MFSPEQLIGDLVAPGVNLWLVEVINEDGHGLPDWRPEGAPHPLVDRGLQRLLTNENRALRVVH